MALRPRRKSFRLAVITLLAVGSLAGASAAYALEIGEWHFNGYDGCSWKLVAEDWYFSPPRASVHDKNGGCHYATVWIQHSAEYHRVGPLNQNSVYADLNTQAGSSFQLRGKVTTWEHEWFWYSDWKTKGYL